MCREAPGGSAACVSAELAPVATATDRGSLRQPASLCGLTEQAYYGRASRYMIAFASSLDQGGGIARPQDAALVLEAMSGHDPKDSTSLN